MMDPILLRYGQDLLKNTMQLFLEKPETRYTKTEWTEKVLKNLIADISSVGSQARNIWINNNASYLKTRKDLRRLYNNYLTSIGEDRISNGKGWDDTQYFMFDDMRTEIFKDGATRQGKHGVSPQYYCLDEVNMWLMANPKRLRNSKPASWAIVRDDEGREVSRVPANISPLHVTPETYGDFSIGLLAELNEGLV